MKDLQVHPVLETDTSAMPFKEACGMSLPSPLRIASRYEIRFY